MSVVINRIFLIAVSTTFLNSFLKWYKSLKTCFKIHVCFNYNFLNTCFDYFSLFILQDGTNGLTTRSKIHVCHNYNDSTTFHTSFFKIIKGLKYRLQNPSAIIKTIL